jgi:hypothetical protein
MAERVEKVSSKGKIQTDNAARKKSGGVVEVQFTPTQ